MGEAKRRKAWEAAAGDILALIDHAIAQHEKGGNFPLLEKFVRRNGRPFAAQPLPAGFVRMPMGGCFTNALILKQQHRGLRYVEGYAVPPAERWLHHHAWTVDIANRVIDPTWPEPESTLYFGVVILNVDDLVALQGATGVFEKNEKHPINGEWKHPLASEWIFARDPKLEAEAERWQGDCAR